MLGVAIWQREAILLAVKGGVQSGVGGVAVTSPTSPSVTPTSPSVTPTSPSEDTSKEEQVVENVEYVGVKAHMLGVRGNAVLLDFRGEYVLIDGGFKEDKSLVFQELRKLGVKRIKYYIVTNYHDANIGSTYDIVSSFDVSYIILPDNIRYTPNGRNLVNLLDKNKFIWSTGNHLVNYEVNKKYKLGFTLLRTYTRNSSIAIRVGDVLFTGTTTVFDSKYLKGYEKVKTLVINGVNHSFSVNNHLLNKVSPTNIIVLGKSERVDTITQGLKSKYEVIKLKGFCKKGVLDIGNLDYTCVK